MPMLNRTSANRKALFRSLTTSLIKYGRIETTLPKAKALRKYADRMITLGKKGDICAKKKAMGWVYEPNTTIPMLFDDISKRFLDRNGGYTRIVKLGYRRFDRAPMAVIEYLNPEAPEKELGFNLAVRKFTGNQEKGNVDVAKALDQARAIIADPASVKPKLAKGSKKAGIQKQVIKLSKNLAAAKIDSKTFIDRVETESKVLESLKQQNRDRKMEAFYKKHFDENTTKLVY